MYTLLLFSYTQSAPTCTSILTFVNVDSGETTVISGDVMPSPENITFDPSQLDTNSNYNVSVLVSNVAGSAVSYTRISECCMCLIWPRGPLPLLSV